MNKSDKNPPIMPDKIIKQHNVIYFPNNEMLLKDFNKWIKRSLPKEAINPVICMSCEDYDDYKLVVEYTLQISNPHYDREVNKYQKQLEKWESKNK